MKKLTTTTQPTFFTLDVNGKRISIKSNSKHVFEAYRSYRTGVITYDEYFNIATTYLKDNQDAAVPYWVGTQYRGRKNYTSEVVDAALNHMSLSAYMGRYEK